MQWGTLQMRLEVNCLEKKSRYHPFLRVMLLQLSFLVERPRDLKVHRKEFLYYLWHICHNCHVLPIVMFWAPTLLVHEMLYAYNICSKMLPICPWQLPFC